MVEKFSFKKGYKGRTVFRIVNIIFMVLTMVAMLIPLLKIFSDSLDLKGNYGMNLIPQDPSIIAYRAIFQMEALYRPFLVSVYVTAVGTVIALALTTVGAYVLIQKDMPGKNFFVQMILFTMIFNGGLVPTYLLMKNIGLINSLWAVILPLSLNVYNMILMKNFFQDIPTSLMESAEIDGCSPMGIFVRIVLPLSKPALASIGLFFAVAFWNEFFHYVIYITDTRKYNFQIKLRELVLDSSASSNQAPLAAEYNINSKTLQNAAIITAILPFMIIYPFCQKYFVQGVTMGAVKE